MRTRRDFLRAGLLAAALPCTSLSEKGVYPRGEIRPVAISTWNIGLPANLEAWKVLGSGGRALDAVEQGIRVVELDPEERSVGLGGRPDIAGRVTLDASIMDGSGMCGAVACLEDIATPISVARRVMEQTTHAMLVGSGARDFAREQGFKRTRLLTEKSRQEWIDWRKGQDRDIRSRINVENHDTVGMIALDTAGGMAGGCSTSGAAWKLPGRVGDSPIIGAGLFVDNEVGGATATGWGEAVIRVAGCHTVVELMRQGHDPEEACRLTVERVIRRNPNYRHIQVGFLALRTDGAFGGFSIQPGFEMAVYTATGGNRLVKVPGILS